MMQNLFSLTGKNALVTGASSGIGRHFAGVLASAGAQVIAGARRTDKLEELVKEIETTGGSAVAVELDVTDQASIDSMFERTSEATGLIDIVVNCAGIVEIGEFTELDDSAWDKVFSVNLDGLRKVSQEVTRQLIVAKRPGVIINVASVAGMNAAPGWTVYATSKAAVIHLTKNMAIELWRHNIRVNALCPGYFPTEMNEEFFASEQGQNYLKRLPPRRTGNLDELTGPLLLLASDASSYITGIALPVDGGHSIRLV
ncbi:MAG: 2-deoxy-D-gluconate 3-dehydrogenase [Rhodospirillaceae bacterium]|nr:2-deoxy-D-gluconate 3-dehydrogenase [Rhodospirillaceae bacterium]|tara:strand:- start:18 stop:788 length:771 start_codon:yes stop_codon:yes gene_type:complete